MNDILPHVDTFEHYQTADIARKWTTPSSAAIVGGARSGVQCMRLPTIVPVLKTWTQDYAIMSCGFALKNRCIIR